MDLGEQSRTDRSREMRREEMILKRIISLVVLSSLICFAAGRNERQSDVLYRLFKKKLLNKASFNTELFAKDTETLNDNEVHVYPQESLKEQDKIEKLPGQPPVKFSQYGGYVTVEKSAGRALYYYFVEAHRHKETKPLLFWLNGGPGCSSLAYGAMEELGPFRVHSDGKTLYKNPYAWNREANVLFLESPAGVGFSYSNTTLDYYDRGDRDTAIDNYVFLLNWLERFPEYKTRDFYISGESYAGHYVPQLADIIIQGNKKSNRTPINLKGIIIGNAAINDETDAKGMYEYFWTHALISDKTNYNIKRYCDFSQNTMPQSRLCQNAATEADAEVVPLDIYNIYGPLCYTFDVTNKPKKASIMEFDPCSDYYVRAYLNRPEVQEALHANVTKLSYAWSPCSQIIISWNDSSSTTLPLLRNAMANGVQVWVYSGDTDGRVPVTSTRSSINKLKLPVNKTWYPWFLQQQSLELAGYSVVYEDGLTFATVRGAGHEVPSFQPKRALTLIQYFLRGKNLPQTS